ncbi:MAG: helix-turn-helix domain-containing protein [Rubrobacteraceae bacterium]|uniref:PucR family transcriptional regulator n=1 Tax=Rubrobacter naiadicus TaxID=1392641 RepID=UPI002362FCA7|nr:helix-turn-helix domain-containing protein [Rubrobacter naiadicus]MBX6764004.1 helix-turn-helix domain-containing protein [Rubrobacteraceae bacterium]MCL6438606.1 helix-turn-helix domain-containing protein [Rubrobacteraceae bacterium]
MDLGEFTRSLTERLGGRCLADGEPEKPLSGIALEDETDGWLSPGEAAVVWRGGLDEDLLVRLRREGCPAVVWRTKKDPPEEYASVASSLGLALITLPPEVPLRSLMELFPAPEESLLLSHQVGKDLVGRIGDGSSVQDVAERISKLLGRDVVVEDPVGRLIWGEGTPLRAALDRLDLRASRSSGVAETRRERRDRYARLPDGFFSIPLERWRVGEEEFHWVPVGREKPMGYLWVDLSQKPLLSEDVIVLYWARLVLEGELSKERVRLETELGVRGDFMDDLVDGHYGSVDILLQRARYLGADLSEGALTVIFDIDEFAEYLERRRLGESSIQELKRRLAEAVRLQSRQLFSNFLLGPRSDNVILLIGPNSKGGSEEVVERAPELASRVQRYVKGLLPELTISVGIGRYAKDPKDLPEAYSEAEVALEIGHRIHGPSAISTFESTGTYKLLFRVLQEDPEEIESFYRDTLEPVVAYDSRYGTELVNTLITYLKNDASMAKTASEIFAHRHTIRYRLERIRELTGLDVDKSEDREQLTLGIKAMQLLGRHPEQTSSFSDR